METGGLLVIGFEAVPNGALMWNDVCFKTEAGFLSLF
jgi:hypothetical protein